MAASIGRDKTPIVMAGVGETVITPSENIQMAGFARSQISTGIHDDLHARCLVIEGINGAATVFMTLSLLGLSEEICGRIRAGITAKTGVPGENIVVSCTHTHSGPDVDRDYPGSKDSPVIGRYIEFLVERSVESAVKAWESRAPGRIGISETEVFELGKNRRRLLYGGVHPDPEAAVIRIEDARGHLLGVAFNYGCHPSGLDFRNTLFSEDWPYYAIRGVKKALGEDVWVAFFQSAEGNINVGYNAELSAVGAEMPVRSHWYLEKKGNQMAEAVLGVLPSMKVSGDIAVRSVIGRFDYPLRDSYPVTVAQAETEAEDARRKLTELDKKPEYRDTRTLDKARVDVFSTQQRLDAARKYYSSSDRPAVRSLEQQAVRIGDAVFVTFPGELFSEIGLAIKKQSPLEKTFIIGVTCGRGGYLPAAKEFIDGDYEIDGSPYSPETEGVCVRSSLELIGQVVK